MKKNIIYYGILLLIATQIVFAIPITPAKAAGLSISNVQRDPNAVNPGNTVTISCTVSSYDLDELAVFLRWRVNGGSLNFDEMSSSGETYTKSIGSFNGGDFVEYRIEAYGLYDEIVTIIRYSPTSSSFYSFTVQSSSNIYWSSPANGATVTMGPGEGLLAFNFNWGYSILDDADIVIGNNIYTIDILTSGTKTTTVYIAYQTVLDGSVTVTLKGYYGGNQVASSARTFTFVWLHYVDPYIYDSGSDVIGDKLYLILHDPSGDGSYSHFSKSQTLSFGGGLEITAGASIDVSASAGLFTAVSAGVELEATVGCEFEYSMTVGTTLSSSKNSETADSIGPGYGDFYWGQGWVLTWQLKTSRTVYYNGDKEYTEPELVYGINRPSELFYNDLNAPDNWKDMNPNHNGYQNVDWDRTITITGGEGEFGEETKIVTTQEISESLSITLKAGAEVDIPGVASAEIEISVGTTLSATQGFEEEEILGFSLSDDDINDIIAQEVGIDQLFGTYVFRTDSGSFTSGPVEHNTIDYRAPEIDLPTIEYNTDGQDPSPSQDDTPKIVVRILDEGGVNNAVAWYSINAGASFSRIDLEEQAANPNYWQGYLPSQSHGTEVLWYIEAWDTTNNAAIRKDAENNAFSYTVINRDPLVTIISPNGGETYSTSILIQWTGNDLDGDDLTYSIGYNIDNTGWQLIVTDIVDQSYLWDISGFSDTNSVLIKLIADDDFGGVVEDISDFSFSIDNEDTPVVTLTSPLSGISYSNILSISWELSDIDDLVINFGLYYSTDSGETWIIIEEDLDKALRNYDWNSSSLVYYDSMKIKVVAFYDVVETTYSVESVSGVFMIDNRPSLVVNLIYPNGGEVYENIISITWSIDTLPDVITSSSLEYSIDGVNWYLIDTDIVDTFYIWDTKDMDYNSNYRVRVIVSGSYLGIELDNNIDISEGAFTLDPDIDNPEITGSSDIVYEFGSTGNEIVWTITDRNLLNYTVTKDGVVILDDELTGTEISISVPVDDLGIGTFSFTIITYDIWGNTATHTVIVEVVDTTAPVVIVLKPTNEQSFEFIEELLDITYEYEIEELSAYDVIVTLNDEIITDDGIMESLGIGTYHLDVAAIDEYDNVANVTIVFYIHNNTAQDPTFEVLIISPNGGEVITKDIVAVSWDLNNPLGLETKYSLYYSSDKGTSWELIAQDLTNTYYQWDTKDFNNSIDYVVKVIAESSYEGKILISEDSSDEPFSIIHDTDTSFIGNYTPGYSSLMAIISILGMIIFTKRRQ